MFLKLTLWGYGLQSPLKRGIKAKGISKLDPEANIWAQEDENGEVLARNG